MKKFKVIASYVSHCYAEIEAESQAEALAREMDGGQFTPAQHNDNWLIDSVKELQP
jgi:hypothetical protein